ALPGLEYIPFLRLGQRSRVREPTQEPFEVRDDRRDRRLHQHEFRDQDPVGVPIRAPGQLPPGVLIPTEEFPPDPFDPRRVLVRTRFVRLDRRRPPHGGLQAFLVPAITFSPTHRLSLTTRTGNPENFAILEKSPGVRPKVSYNKCDETRVTPEGAERDER